jgi:hypothetical protein
MRLFLRVWYGGFRIYLQVMFIGQGSTIGLSSRSEQDEISMKIQKLALTLCKATHVDRPFTNGLLRDRLRDLNTKRIISKGVP